MKCIIRNCDKEANLPSFACGKSHGFDWKNIKQAIKDGYDNYKSYPYNKPLTEEDKEYYKKFI